MKREKNNPPTGGELSNSYGRASTLSDVEIYIRIYPSRKLDANLIRFNFDLVSPRIKLLAIKARTRVCRA